MRGGWTCVLQWISNLNTVKIVCVRAVLLLRVIRVKEG
jgi:hypothetical protein